MYRYYGGVLSLFVNLSRSRRIKFVKLHVFGNKIRKIWTIENLRENNDWRYIYIYAAHCRMASIITMIGYMYQYIYMEAFCHYSFVKFSRRSKKIKLGYLTYVFGKKTQENMDI